MFRLIEFCKSFLYSLFFFSFSFFVIRILNTYLYFSLQNAQRTLTASRASLVTITVRADVPSLMGLVTNARRVTSTECVIGNVINFAQMALAIERRESAHKVCHLYIKQKLFTFKASIYLLPD